MNHSYPLKNPPISAQMLIRPMLLISLGLHGLLLFLPIGSDENPVLAKKQEAVKITQLSTSPSSKPAAKSAAKPSAKKAQQPTQRATSLDRPRSVVTPGPQTAETSQSNPASNQAASGSEASAEGEGAGAGNPFADFPHYPGAKTGCFGKDSCRQTTDELKLVAAYFEKQLPAKKYDIQPGANEASKKVYQVSKGGLTQYLNLFAEQGTVYVLAPDPLNLEDIKQAVEIPDELYVVLSEIKGKPASDTDFDDPGYFYDKLSSQDETGSALIGRFKSEIEGSPQLVSGKTPDQVFSNLAPKLEVNGLKASPAKPYGGGDLYELQKGTATAGYLNLVPDRDRTGTLVIIWTSSPN